VTDALIRPARAADLADLTELYNHYIRETAITFDLVPFTLEQRRAWLEGFGETGRHRLFVAEAAGRAVGFASSHQFRTKAAYDTSVETSVYLAPGHTGRRLGTRLYQVLFEALRGENVHRALAGITLPNPASVALHRRFGFESVGVFAEVGYKFERFWDVEWFQRPVGPLGPSRPVG
jgi:phosphinothricin acetyltransferase